MRTALVLLFLLALASVPGSLLPQRPLNPTKVDQYIADAPGLVAGPRRGRLLRRVRRALVRGDLPAAVHLADRLRRAAADGARRAPCCRAPPAVPRRLERLPAADSFAAGRSARRGGGRRGRAAARLADRDPDRGRRRGDGRRREGLPPRDRQPGLPRRAGRCCWSASRSASCCGYQGTGAGHRGQPGICNAVPLYDSFRPGSSSTVRDLAPFCIDRSTTSASTTTRTGRRPQFARRHHVLSSAEDGAGREDVLEVNHPLRVDGVRVYLLGHGFAPRFTVTKPDGTGSRTSRRRSCRRTRDAAVARARSKLLDTADDRSWRCTARSRLSPPSVRTASRPRCRRSPAIPAWRSQVYRGDLGVDGGAPQSIYSIDQRQVATAGSSRWPPRS